jgi:lysyl-tRNA synthetase class I
MAGLISQDAERERCQQRGVRPQLAREVRPRRLPLHDPPRPKTRALSPDEATCLGRIVEVLRANPTIDEDGLVPTMKTLTEGTPLDNKTFLPVVYDLLIGRDKGPKLTTLITAMGISRALELLAPSLEPAS